jgi:hypothetical protein
MINQLSVLNTVAANGADAIIDNKGNLSITGAGSIPANSVTMVSIVPASAEQIQKTTLTFTSANSTNYRFVIQGYAMSSGAYTEQLVQFTSAASASLTTVSLQAIEAINGLSDLNVSATNAAGGVTGDASGIVVLTAKAATSASPDAQTFNVAENDTNIAITTAATATAAAAPTGGKTAVLEPVINASGVMTSIRIIDGGLGYLVAPAITIANGGGAGSVAPTATAVIFEGAIVRIVFTAGTTYTYNSYKGFKVVGTGAAIQASFGYVGNTAQAAVAPQFQALANLTAGSNYTQILINYVVAPISNNTAFSSPVTTGQILVCVLESATNAALLTSAYGIFANLEKGFASNISACVALDGTTAVTTSEFVVGTGVVTLSAANSNGIQAGDLLLIGAAPIFANTTTNAIAKVVGIQSNSAVLAQIGGGNLATAIPSGAGLATSVIKRTVISR